MIRGKVFTQVGKGRDISTAKMIEETCFLKNESHSFEGKAKISELFNLLITLLWSVNFRIACLQCFNIDSSVELVFIQCSLLYLLKFHDFFYYFCFVSKSLLFLFFLIF